MTLYSGILCPLHFQSQSERKMVMGLENLAYFPPIIDKIGLCEKNVRSLMRHRSLTLKTHNSYRFIFPNLTVMIISRGLYWVLLDAAYIRMRPTIVYTKMCGLKVDWALFTAAYIQMRLYWRAAYKTTENKNCRKCGCSIEL